MYQVTVSYECSSNYGIGMFASYEAADNCRHEFFRQSPFAEFASVKVNKI